MFATIVLAAANTTMAQTVLDRSRKDDIVRAPEDDPAMAKAFRKAQTTLNNFLATANSPPPNTTSFAVKVAIRDKRETEYFWILPFSHDGDSFKGKINNTPRLVKHVRRGEEVRFSRSEIVDWMYVDTSNRRMYGNFTACALLTHESPVDAEKFRKQYGLDCDL